MDLEQEVRRNTTDIAAVTNTVTRLAAVQENAERQRAEDRELMRRAVEGLTTLNEKMSVTIVMQENIKRLTESDAEIKSDVRTLRHDHNNTKQTIQGIALLRDLIAEGEKKGAALSVRVDALEGRQNSTESRIDKFDGASGAFRMIGQAMWALFGAMVLGVLYFVLRQYFAQAGK